MAKKMIELADITPEQLAHVDEIKQKWIDQATEQYDDKTICESVDAVFAAIGKPKPLAIVVDSPMEARAYSALLSARNAS